MDKCNESEQERLTFIRKESHNTRRLNRRRSNISISSDSSEESIPSDAPLARQQRCSVDIDTLVSKSNVKAQINGMPNYQNAYLDDFSVNDSVQDIASESSQPPDSRNSSINLPALPIQKPNASNNKLRRNSISLPVLNNIDLEALKKLNEISTIDSSTSHTTVYSEKSVKDERSDTESPLPSPCKLIQQCKVSSTNAGNDIELAVDQNIDSDSDNEKKKLPQTKSFFRTKRRLSVAPLPALRLNDKEMMANEFESQSMISNQNSISSVNSLASLLKEKMQMFPSMIRRKKENTSDLKIKAFVLTLFMIIVFLIGYAYIMYEQHVLSYLYFGRIQFDKDTRVFRIFEHRRKFIEGRLGRNILDGKPFHCVQGNANDGSLCIEWDSEVRLYLNEDKTRDGCFTLRWQALKNGTYPTDCFDIGDKVQWYGGGMTKRNDWPISRAKFDFEPFITGDARVQQFSNALNRYFISSHNVAIRVDERTPLYISMNRSNSNEFCLKAMNDNFAFVNRMTPHPELSYNICIAEDMRKLHHFTVEKNLSTNLTDADLKTVHTLMEEPVWQIPASSFDQLTESVILNYTLDVVAVGYLKPGHILVNEFWQKEIGDFTVDTKRFEHFAETIKELHRRGFRIVLTVQPFISTDSESFKESVEKKLLIYERLSERSIPALTRYKSAPSTGVLDVTVNTSWLLQKLKKIVKFYQVDSFFLDFGSAFNLPHYYQLKNSLHNPDQYKTIFGRKFEDSIKIWAYSGAISPPKLPSFLSLPPVNASWEGLQSILPTALAYGVIGYPFIISGAVGGDYYVPGNITTNFILSYHSLDTPQLPDQELFIRWFQLSTFLPVMRFSHLPEEYKSDFITVIAKELTELRGTIVIPTLKKYLNEAINDGKPLIRPLWMLDSTEACLQAENEFAVGDDLVVAPSLFRGQTKRNIYLPGGIWKDGRDGTLRKGFRVLQSYHVPLDKVAYFIRMPPDTKL